jgi:hypothetical protein
MTNLGVHEGTSIWARTLAYRKDDPAEEARSRLRNAYESLRRNTSFLVAQITKELPQLTLHDIRHLDALWTTADLIAGPSFILSPSEAFVFGGAVLLHDAGHALASLRGGLLELIDTPEWRDAAVGILESANNFPITSEKIKKPPPELFEDILFSTLRALHGRIADSLASIEFLNETTGSRLQLFEDTSLRIHYGAIIGQIAASHSWEIEDLPLRLQTRVGAISGTPNDWTIDPVKVACLLRCADAAQIDQQRSPDFLFALLKLRGMSRNHWLAQNKMAQPIHDSDDVHAVIYSSTSAYSEKEAEAWWVAFDLVSIINRELRACNTLLRETQRDEFLVTRVRDVEAPTRLAKHITTNGWTPVHAEVQISNSTGVARMLGGEVLYGDFPIVTVRELIQNAADSIRARRHFDKSNIHFEGRILIKIRENEVNGNKSVYLEVLDDGIGMAQQTLVGPLLDFGTSLWKNRLLESEFPGLRGSAFKPIGRFGIGFYSVFMVADAVSVASRRFDQGTAQGRTLIFSNGLAARPILLDRLPADFSSNFQTVVSLTLKWEAAERFGGSDEKAITSSLFDSSSTLEGTLSHVCPSLDCDVFFQRNDDPVVKIHDRYWYKADGEKWLETLFAPKTKLNKKYSVIIAEAASRLSLIYDGDEVVGRAAISIGPSAFFDPRKGPSKQLRDDLFVSGHLTFGGLSSEHSQFVTATNSFFGIIDGRPSHASRMAPPLLMLWNLGSIFRYPEQKQKWVKEQTEKLQSKPLSIEQTSALRENMARFGDIQPGYFTFRIIEPGINYEKMSDIPVKTIAEIGDGLDQFEIHLPTIKLRAGEEFQTFVNFDRKHLKLLFRVISDLGIPRLYFPLSQDSSQMQTPRDLPKDEDLSGIFAGLITSLKERGFDLEMSIQSIPKPIGIDKSLSKLFERYLDRIVTVKGTRH